MKKKILLIGGSYGIGLEMAKKLSKDHHVFVASRSSELLSNPNITHIPFDALKEDISEKVIPEKLDGFVYCPGSINLKPFKTMGIDTIQNDMEINFFALVKAVKSIINRMNEGSSMVFFSTVAVGTGMPFHTSVAAAKGAIEGFARALAAEYAPKIRVNVVAPSLVDTPLSERLLSNDKKKELINQRHPMKRVGKTGDIANMATFLLDSNNSWVTGQVIGVDGGMSTLNVN
ncbi:SDR family NAD(P)-dependent oxidoreductase [Flagellimonas zhangzhouensis]|uniref:NAD(P)-dependent dehydrogenase, short-chain alcohol dehydrogenase family n=1 Tax=Flagellimonas zhangzhouensis TaxID=1073328 RepID=A0A1H2SWU9_9FLAO|nr:SDR family oxidoreductase [Allomuricauda zhangzhouensis]SDQ80597.1 NAD(P)-dependent dehydrogenase, short-chain alcohol dehydrogenase family [Allomuricauda zhangzhouensis]SDW36070.1 NAD(P)-dependent dehydrogenase, short-chain alcohol dehydrogenase family [Allomuricauda zhangzhouensis]